MFGILLEIFLVCGYVFFFLFLIGRLPFFKVEGISSLWLRLMFLLKVFAGIFLGLIYTYYYTDRSTADIFKYFDDSAIMFNALWTAPLDFLQMFTGFYGKGDHLWNYFDEMNNWFNSRYFFSDSRTMIRLNTLFRFFSLGSYYVHSVFICFLSFTGLVALLKLALRKLPGRPFTLLLLIFLFPSLIFWGSGVLKESLLLFALGTLLFVSDNFIRQASWPMAVLSLILIFLLLNIKPYILAMLLPSMAAYVWLKYNASAPLSKFLLVHLLYLAAIIFFTQNFFGNTFPELLTAKQMEFIRVADVQEAQSVISLPELNNSYKNILLYSPQGFFTSLCRPHLLEVKNPLMLISALENAVLLLLLIFAVWQSLKNRVVKFSHLLLFSIFFVLILFTLIGLVTPILGAIVRYKVPALPFLGIALAHFIDLEGFFRRRITKLA